MLFFSFLTYRRLVDGSTRLMGRSTNRQTAYQPAERTILLSSGKTLLLCMGKQQQQVRANIKQIPSDDMRMDTLGHIVDIRGNMYG